MLHPLTQHEKRPEERVRCSAWTRWWTLPSDDSSSCRPDWALCRNQSHCPPLFAMISAVQVFLQEVGSWTWLFLVLIKGLFLFIAISITFSVYCISSIHISITNLIKVLKYWTGSFDMSLCILCRRLASNLLTLSLSLSCFYVGKASEKRRLLLMLFGVFVYFCSPAKSRLFPVQVYLNAAMLIIENSSLLIPN